MQERKIAFYTIKTARWTYLLKYSQEFEVNINIKALNYPLSLDLNFTRQNIFQYVIIFFADSIIHNTTKNGRVSA